MKVLLKLNPEHYDVREFPETGTLLVVRRGTKGPPDYSLEGEGFVIEFKNGEIYTIDIYDPKVARRFKNGLLIEVS